MPIRTGISNYFLQRDRGLLVTLLAAVCLAYLPFLGNPFIFDDTNFIQKNFLKHYSQGWFQFELRSLMKDTLVWTSPFGILGKIVDKLLLERHLLKLVSNRNARLKEIAEASNK